MPIWAILLAATCDYVCKFDYRKKSVAPGRKGASWLYTSNHQ